MANSTANPDNVLGLSEPTKPNTSKEGKTMTTETTSPTENIKASDQPIVRNAHDIGTWYQAACSGLWYESAGACGTVQAVRVDGEVFLPMPYQLTAENGAKALLMGEFSESIRVDNPEYCGCGGLCAHDEGMNYTLKQDVPVSWTTIKQIYDNAVRWFLHDRPRD